MSAEDLLSEFEFDRASSRDFLAIAALDRQAWKASAHADFIPDGEHVWRIWVDGALVYVARRDSAVLGALLAFPVISGAYCIHKVMVASDWRKQGIGSRLFEILLGEIDRQGDKECFLTVDPANIAALRLYAKWGFTGKRFVSGFYREQEDRYVLTRSPLLVAGSQ
jgi:ribosomal protein S18 acetylase RimI-like enzyme